ncbi:hypothetical protein [Elizabethkingia ursingii]|uniref:hypothetical protein n=1 Tax=Elizabethkingia ursingii TaxID=1756150 RepID=UPI000751586E|nr:hypothetical protein [Elizabethkingia ursingii]KUY25525.1 hypothetical protein ATB96_07695 [Elizabethkingia ursingii]
MDFFYYISNYWAQISIFIIAIGYLLKILLEFQIQKSQIKFNFIHAERVKVIKEIYKNFMNISKDLEFLALGHQLADLKQGPTRSEARDLMWRIIENNKLLKKNLDENKLYFSQKFTRKMDAFNDNIAKFCIIPSVNMSSSTSETSIVIYNDSKTFLKFYRKTFPRIEKAILRQFKKYI